jgi:hypothetical protein
VIQLHAAGQHYAIDPFLQQLTLVFDITGSKGPPPMNGEHDSADLARFAEIIRKLQAHDPSGMDDLRTMFDRGLRLLLARRGVQDLAGC